MTNFTNQYVPSIGLGTYNMSSEEAELTTFHALKHGYCLLYTSDAADE